MKRLREDRGAVVVEAAFVLPILIAVILGLVDIGFAVFQTSQATSAARDGARVAILSYAHADVSGSSDNNAVVAQVNGRLAGQHVQSITVSCLSGESGSTTVTCANAAPNTDRIRVVVTWTYVPLTPIGLIAGHINISGTTTMGIVGSPVAAPTTTSTTSTTTTSPSSTTSTSTSTTTTTVQGSCVVTGLSMSPAPPVNTKNNGSLVSDTTFTATTNGAATCTNLQIQYPTSPSATRPMTSAGGNTWTDTVSKNSLNWVTGTNESINVLDSGGTVLPGGGFLVTVS